MKILITNNHLHTYGGSETWTVTVFNELSKEHDVDVFTFSKYAQGGAALEFDHIFTELNPPKDHYDLILCNHNSCHQWVIENVSYDKLTFISHGTVPQLEQPLGHGTSHPADRIVSVSEEIQTHILKSYSMNSVVINNPVDLERFYPIDEIKKPPSLLMSMCQGVEAQQNIQGLAPTRVLETNRHKRILLSAKDWQRVDVVFSLGRGAYESLACGRPVILYDTRGYQGGYYDGLITDKNIKNLLRYNCSGRATRGGFTRTRAQEDMKNIKTSDYYRAIAEKYFDAKKICKQLIEA